MRTPAWWTIVATEKDLRRPINSFSMSETEFLLHFNEMSCTVFKR